jgi:hypothetical protein
MTQTDQQAGQRYCEAEYDDRQQLIVFLEKIVRLSDEVCDEDIYVDEYPELGERINVGYVAQREDHEEQDDQQHLLLLRADTVTEELQERSQKIEDDVVGYKPVLSDEWRKDAFKDINVTDVDQPCKVKDDRDQCRIKGCFENDPQDLLDRERTA